MKMTPQEFIRYYSKPSIKITSYRARGTFIIGETIFNIIEDKDEQGSKYFLASGENREDLKIPFLNNGRDAGINGVNREGTIFVERAHDGAKHNRQTAVQWINGKVFSTQDLLQSHGVDLQGYHIEFVNFVNANGLQVRGRCYQELEHPIFFTAILPFKYTRSDFATFRVQPG